MSPTNDFDLFVKTHVSHRFEVLDDGRTTFCSEHHYAIKAEIRSRFFKRRYWWSGSPTDSPPEILTEHDMWGHPKHVLHGPVISEGKWRTVIVDLGRTFERGEETTVRYKHRFLDLEGKFQPFLAHRPTPGTKHISLTVILPSSLARNVVSDEMVLDTERVVNSQPLTGDTINGKLRFSREVVNPVESNLAYRICWRSPA